MPELSMTSMLKPNNPTLYRQDIWWTLKSYQELSRFTDVDIYCDDGVKLSMHKGLLSRLSPFLRDFFNLETCCSCYGQTCHKRSENFGISLAEVDSKSVEMFLELIYTGRTHFPVKSDSDKVQEILDLLKIRIPLKSFSFEEENVDRRSGLKTVNLNPNESQMQGDKNDRPVRDVRVEVKNMANQIMSSPARRTVPTWSENNSETSSMSSPRPLQTIVKNTESSTNRKQNEFDQVDSEGKRKCPKCKMRVSIRNNWYSRHLKRCDGTLSVHFRKLVQDSKDEVEESEESITEEGNAEKETETTSAIGETIDGRIKCPKCDKSYRLGWYKRHRRINCPLDPGEIDANLTEPEENDEIPEEKSATLLQKNLSETSAMADMNAESDIDEIVEGFAFRVYDNEDQLLAKVSKTEGLVTESADVITSTPVVEHGKQSCKFCGNFFSIMGGWIRKHEKTCDKRSSQELETKEENEASFPGVLPSTSRLSTSQDSLLSEGSMIEEESVEEKIYLGRKRQCKKCHQFISLNFVQHVRTCLSQDEANVDHMRSENTKRVCPECNKSISVAGGHYVKHVRICTGALSTTQQASSPPQLLRQPKNLTTGSGQCPKCKRIITHVSGWYKRHVKKCENGTDDEAVGEEGEEEGAHEKKQALDEGGEGNHCKFCGKFFDNHHTWHFQQHEAIKCKLNPMNLEFNPIVQNRLENEESPMANAPGGVPCYICNSVFVTRPKLKMHMVNHFRNELRDKFNIEASLPNCPFDSSCQYKTDKAEHMLVHLSLTHGKIRDYIPHDEAQYIFDKVKFNKKRKAEELKSSLMPGLGKRPKVILDDMETASNASSTSSNASCHVCHLQFSSKHLFRQHLFCHVKHDIRKKYLPMGSNQRKCQFCQYQTDNLENHLMHLAITHKKLREFIPQNLSDELYPPVPQLNKCLPHHHHQQQQPQPQKPNEKTSEKSAVSNLKGQRVPPGYKSNNEQVAGKKGLTCPNCRMSFGNLFRFKMHVIKHFMQEIKDLMVGEFSDKRHCAICHFKAPTDSHLVFHYGVKHSFLLKVVSADLRKLLIDTENRENAIKNKGQNKVQFITPETTQVLRALTNKDTAKEPQQQHGEDFSSDFDPPQLLIQSTSSLANGYKKESTSMFPCEKCEEIFDSHLELTRHMTLVNCNSGLTNKSNNESSGNPDAVKGKSCHLCDEKFTNFIQYKSHLLFHFEEKLSREIGTEYEKLEDGKCDFCSLKCKTLRLFVRHLSVDHGRILSYIPQEEKSTLAEDFGISLSEIEDVETANNSEAKSPKLLVEDSDEEDDISTIILGETEEEINLAEFASGSEKLNFLGKIDRHVEEPENSDASGIGNDDDEEEEDLVETDDVGSNEMRLDLEEEEEERDEDLMDTEEIESDLREIAREIASKQSTNQPNTSPIDENPEEEIRKGEKN